MNEQVHRNTTRFPGDFVFKMAREEFESLRSQDVTTAGGRVTQRSQNAILRRRRLLKNAVFPALAIRAIRIIIFNRKPPVHLWVARGKSRRNSE